jgi:hypothetical protein
MDEEQLYKLYRIIKYGYDNTCWDSISDSLDYLREYVETDDEDVTED